MQIIPVMIRQLKINLQVKSDLLIYKKLTKSAKISKYIKPGLEMQIQQAYIKPGLEMKKNK